MPGGSCGLPQYILHGTADAAVAGRRDAQGDADPVGRAESDALQIVAQTVRVLPDYFLRAVSVEQGDLHRKGGRDSVGLQEDHALPGGLVFAVTLGNQGHFFRADARDFRQPLRMLGKNRERFFTELADNLGCGGGPDALDDTAAQVPFDAQQRGRRLNLTGNAFKLSPVGFMLGPFPEKHSLFPGPQRRQRSHNGNLAASGADGQHGPAIFIIAENGSKDSPLQLFHPAPPLQRGLIRILCHSVPRNDNGNKMIFRKKKRK